MIITLDIYSKASIKFIEARMSTLSRIKYDEGHLLNNFSSISSSF